MTELREKVRDAIVKAVRFIAPGQLGFEGKIDEATDAIMALLAGGSGEVSEEAVEAAREATKRAATPYPEKPTEEFERKLIRAALTAAYALDRPAVVVKPLEWEGSWANSPYGKFEVKVIDEQWTCITPFDEPDLPYYARTPHRTKAAAMQEGQSRFAAAVEEDRARISKCVNVSAPVVVKEPDFFEAEVGRWRCIHAFGIAEIVQTAPSTYQLDICFNDELDEKVFSSRKGAEDAFAADFARRISECITARVVDREAVERVCRNLSAQVFNQTHSGVSFDGMLPYQKAATDAILSAVNAVSEAQVRADERERLAKRAGAELYHDWIEGEFDPTGPEAFAQWLRAQGESK